MVKEISVKELKDLLDKNADFQLVDVREPHEFAIASIGGKEIPLGQIVRRYAEIDTQKQVVVYCRSGKRSATAIEALQQNFGHNNLYNLKGGILAWADEIDQSVTKY